MIKPDLVISNTPEEKYSDSKDVNSPEIEEESEDYKQESMENSFLGNKIRSPFHRATINVPLESPLSVIQKFYEGSEETSERQACLRYLLQYQRYNAEFTESENKRLGYPQPLSAAQKYPGYVRTEYRRFIQVMEPWVKRYLGNFFKNLFSISDANIKDYINLSCDSVISVLNDFYSNKYCIEELNSFSQDLLNSKKAISQEGKAEKEKKENIKKIILIKLSLSNLESFFEKTSKDLLQKIRRKFPDIKFLFIIETGVDCAIMWGGQWDPGQKQGSTSLVMQPLLLDKLFDELSEEKVFSFLNSSGNVPDRMAIHQLMTMKLGEKPDFKSDLKEIGIRENDDKFGYTDSDKIWQEYINEMKGHQFQNKGCELYYRAILKWQSEFFTNLPGQKGLISALLCSQVKPWMQKESGIVQYAKGYQNLCEIVMFCLDYFPNFFRDITFESTISNIFQGEVKLNNIKKSVAIYPYAMTVFYDIFSQFLEKIKGTSQPLTISCVSQNYFETLNLARQMTPNEHHYDLKDSLEEITGTPNILICDIHPNNANRKRTFQNDIVSWTKKKLEFSESKIVIVLDATLNYLADQEIRDILVELSDLIVSKKLEIFVIQSLAKLVQLGADNFSGGSCLYLGEDDFKPFRKTLSQKMTYFTLLHQHFQEITLKYFDYVRSNVDWMLSMLGDSVQSVKETVFIETDIKQIKDQFCAVEIKVNVDKGAVYVPLGFEPFFEKLKSKFESYDILLIEGDPQEITKGIKNLGKPILIKQPESYSLWYKSKKEKTIDDNKIDIFKQLSFSHKLEILSSIKLPKEIRDEIDLKKSYSTTSKSYDLYLIEGDPKDILKNQKIPVLIKQPAQYFFYGLSENGNWELAKNFNNNLLKELKFTNKLENLSRTQFSNKLDILYAEIKSRKAHNSREAFVKEALIVLLTLAASRGLPITGRQSFGFSTSNMGRVVDSIRFYIGIEEDEMLNLYTDIITDFNYALSKFLANNLNEFDMNKFSEHIISVYAILENGNTPIILENVPLKKENIAAVLAQEPKLIRTFNEDEFTKNEGYLDIHFKDNLLQLYNQKTSINAKPNIISEPNISCYIQYPSYYIFGDNTYWPYSWLFKLFFQILAIDSKSIRVINNAICGFMEVPYLFSDEKDENKIIDLEYKNIIYFSPHFYVEAPDGSRYYSDKIYVRDNRFGSYLISLSRAESYEDIKNKIYSRCLHYHFKVEPLKNLPGSIQLIFFKKKPHEDYANKINSLMKDGLPLICLYLNSLDFANLPLLEHQSWRKFAQKPLDNLQQVLYHLGNTIAFNLNKSDVVQILGIKDWSCQRYILKGIFNFLEHGFLSQNYFLTSTVAEAMAEIFAVKELQGAIDLDLINNWIVVAEKILLVFNSHISQKLRPYFTAILPLIKFYYNIPDDLLRNSGYSPSLSRLAQSAHWFPELLHHVNGLEGGLINQVSPKSSRITPYLIFYINYPMDEKITDQLLAAIRQKPKKLIYKWLGRAGFFYSPLDGQEIDELYPDDETPILEKASRPAIGKFFQEIECKSILLEKLSGSKKNGRILDLVFRWAILVQDKNLFSALLEIFRKEKLHEETKINLIKYGAHLEKNDPLQSQLLNYLIKFHEFQLNRNIIRVQNKLIRLKEIINGLILAIEAIQELRALEVEHAAASLELDELSKESRKISQKYEQRKEEADVRLKKLSFRFNDIFDLCIKNANLEKRALIKKMHQMLYLLNSLFKKKSQLDKNYETKNENPELDLARQLVRYVELLYKGESPEENKLIHLRKRIKDCLILKYPDTDIANRQLDETIYQLTSKVHIHPAYQLEMTLLKEIGRDRPTPIEEKRVFSFINDHPRIDLRGSSPDDDKEDDNDSSSNFLDSASDSLGSTSVSSSTSALQSDPISNKENIGQQREIAGTNDDYLRLYRAKKDITHYYSAIKPADALEAKLRIIELRKYSANEESRKKLLDEKIRLLDIMEKEQTHDDEDKEEDSKLFNQASIKLEVLSYVERMNGWDLANSEDRASSTTQPAEVKKNGTFSNSSLLFLDFQKKLAELYDKKNYHFKVICRPAEKTILIVLTNFEAVIVENTEKRSKEVEKELDGLMLAFQTVAREAGILKCQYRPNFKEYTLNLDGELGVLDQLAKLLQQLGLAVRQFPDTVPFGSLFYRNSTNTMPVDSKELTLSSCLLQ